MDRIFTTRSILIAFGVGLSFLAFSVGFLFGAALSTATLILSLISFFMSCEPSQARKIFLIVGSISFVVGWGFAVVSIYDLPLYKAVAFGSIAIATFHLGIMSGQKTDDCKGKGCPGQ